MICRGNRIPRNQRRRGLLRDSSRQVGCVYSAWEDLCILRRDFDMYTSKLKGKSEKE